MSTIQPPFTQAINNMIADLENDELSLTEEKVVQVATNRLGEYNVPSAVLRRFAPQLIQLVRAHNAEETCHFITRIIQDTISSPSQQLLPPVQNRGEQPPPSSPPPSPSSTVIAPTPPSIQITPTPTTTTSQQRGIQRRSGEALSGESLLTSVAKRVRSVATTVTQSIASVVTPLLSLAADETVHRVSHLCQSVPVNRVTTAVTGLATTAILSSLAGPALALGTIGVSAATALVGPRVVRRLQRVMPTAETMQLLNAGKAALAKRLRGESLSVLERQKVTALLTNARGNTRLNKYLRALPQNEQTPEIQFLITYTHKTGRIATQYATARPKIEALMARREHEIANITTARSAISQVVSSMNTAASARNSSYLSSPTTYCSDVVIPELNVFINRINTAMSTTTDTTKLEKLQAIITKLQILTTITERISGDLINVNSSSQYLQWRQEFDQISSSLQSAMSEYMRTYPDSFTPSFKGHWNEFFSISERSLLSLFDMRAYLNTSIIHLDSMLQTTLPPSITEKLRRVLTILKKINDDLENLQHINVQRSVSMLAGWRHEFSLTQNSLRSAILELQTVSTILPGSEVIMPTFRHVERELGYFVTKTIGWENEIRTQQQTIETNVTTLRNMRTTFALSFEEFHAMRSLSGSNNSVPALTSGDDIPQLTEWRAQTTQASECLTLFDQFIHNASDFNAGDVLIWCFPLMSGQREKFLSRNLLQALRSLLHFDFTDIQLYFGGQFSHPAILNIQNNSLNNAEVRGDIINHNSIHLPDLAQSQIYEPDFSQLIAPRGMQHLRHLLRRLYEHTVPETQRNPTHYDNFIREEIQRRFQTKVSRLLVTRRHELDRPSFDLTRAIRSFIGQDRPLQGIRGQESELLSNLSGIFCSEFVSRLLTMTLSHVSNDIQREYQEAVIELPNQFPDMPVLANNESIFNPLIPRNIPFERVHPTRMQELITQNGCFHRRDESILSLLVNLPDVEPAITPRPLATTTVAVASTPATTPTTVLQQTVSIPPTAQPVQPTAMDVTQTASPNN